MGSLLRELMQLPPVLIYLVIGLGAAVENLVPPVPADTFVLLGAFLAAAGRANAWIVFFATWICNVAGALGVYAVAWRFGEGFFQTRVGHFLLNPRQLEHIGSFYDRWGVAAIFVSRFLPAFRAMVPVFAGVTRASPWKVAPPLAIASGVWYGTLVYLGAFAGRNFGAIVRFFERASTILMIVAGLLLLGFTVWWARTRRHHPPRRP
ncbi:MAG TPA: DedA family protein [Longimicrobiales bacterium]|nr:DedA family protein [Longimicrobiales bacterium]